MKSVKSMKSQGSGGINFIEMKRKLTNDYDKIKTFEGRQKSRRSTKNQTKVDPFKKSGAFKSQIEVFQEIKEEEHNRFGNMKENYTIMQMDNALEDEPEKPVVANLNSKIYLNKVQSNEAMPNDQ